MTRKDSARAATGTARENVRHAVDVVGPKAALAARQAQHTARDQYESVLAPRLAQARNALPQGVDEAASRVSKKTRRAAKEARKYAGPKLEAARAAAAPARDEALDRSTAALAALRGQVTAAQVAKLNKKRVRRARTGRAVKKLAVLGIVSGLAMAAWKWWDQQANPDWLVEPPAPTDVSDRASATAADGSLDTEVQAELDPEVQAKQAESDSSEDGNR
ncbi:DUF5324 family protein [Streptomyces sp. JJ66]|uniref:DUF5324 family protein n=1 Tax=Streptomyces sp. JJ66 TaxID=2803843 RepID=UPI001C572809|nr:DUF5324 family protein [Streptomyces sp. JJ66]MBW1601808.1 DUF5324 family protein [Streptomyces sp. JJ66]